MRNAVARAIIKKAEFDKDLFLIVGDAGLGLFDEFRQKGQFLNTGINEAAAVGLAAGLNLAGKRAIYYNIAPFTLLRPYEQLRNDICYQNLSVILVGIGCGLTYAPAGMTHYGIDDIAVALTLPNLQIFSPSDANEAASCFEYAYKSQKPSYIRIPKNGDPIFHAPNVDILTPQILRQGEEILLLTHSNLLSELLKAGEILNASVMSVPFINNISEDLLNLMALYKFIFVVEEHFEFGGLGSFLANFTPFKIHKIAIKNHFIHKIGSQNFLRLNFGLDAKNIIKSVENVMRGGGGELLKFP